MQKDIYVVKNKFGAGELFTCFDNVCVMIINSKNYKDAIT